jgi:tetratricopeptide (TPR) repeat protein
MTLSDDERARLESEREFLLRSLDDLDLEHAEGGIDADTFAVLHADYTARAASVTRRLAGQPDERVVASKQDPRWMLTAVGLAIIVLTITLGVVMFAAPRGDNDSLTGKDLSPTTTTIDLQDAYDALVAAVDANPDSLAARLDLGLFLFQALEYQAASEQLANAVRIDPDNIEAQTFYGWAVWQLSQQAPEGDGRNELIDIAFDHLSTAIGLAPEDASANTFYGIVLLRGKADPAGAIPYLEKAIDLAGSQAPPMLSAALDEARATVSGSTTTSTEG